MSHDPQTDFIAFDSESLLKLGFVAHEYDGQDGIFYRRLALASTMPRLSQEIDPLVDDILREVIVTEVMPGGSVQASSMGVADFVDGPYRADSTEGQALLRDALAGSPASPR